MRRFLMTSTSAGLLVLAASFVGCGGDSGPAPGSGFLTEATPTDFKSTDTNQFNKMMDEMKGVQKSGAHAKRPVPKSKEKVEEPKKQ
jgi:hypothetical protein